MIGHLREESDPLVSESFANLREQLPEGVDIHVESRKFTSNSPALIDMLEDARINTVGILAPMNTGKTTLIKDYLSRIPNHYKVLVVTSRRTLAAFLAMQFAHFGAVNYLDLGQQRQYQSTRFIVVQLESLFKIHPPGQNGGFPR
jgi:hypothetical protein